MVAVGGRLVINPGSVGLPAYDHDVPWPHVMEAGSPHARYALLTRGAEGWQIDQVLVPYPWEEAAAQARRNGRPDWGEWIATGRYELRFEAFDLVPVALGVEDPDSFEVLNSRHYPRVGEMADHLYRRLQRRGYLHREVERMVNQDRNIFAACLLALGEADAMITGLTRTYAQNLRQIMRVLDPKEGVTPFGIHVLVGQSHTVFLADTTVTERPSADQLEDIAIHTAQFARRMGHDPRVAFLSYSNFGNPEGSYLERIRDAVKRLDARDDIDFEYEGEMAADVALNPALQKIFPFSRLTGPANVLVMPGLQTANISAKLLKELGGDALIGPMLVGMEHQVQIAPMTASASDLVTLAVLAAGRMAR